MEHQLNLSLRTALDVSRVASRFIRHPSFKKDLLSDSEQTDHQFSRTVSGLDIEATTPVSPGTDRAEEGVFKPLDPKEVETTTLVALTSLVHLRECSGEMSLQTLEEYVQKMFSLPRDKLEQLKERTNEAEHPELKLICTVLDATDLIAKDANGKSDPFCRLGILPFKYQSSHQVKHKNLQSWQKEGIVKDVVTTTVRPATLTPEWGEHFELSLTNPKEELLVLEVWDSDKESVGATKIRGLKGLKSFLADLKKGEDDFMGRAFYRLQTIPVDGEEKTLALYSHSGKSNYGKVRLSLIIRGLRENTPIEESLMEHKMLVTAMVDHESKKDGHYQHWWDANLSDVAEKLLLQHAMVFGINKLQKAAVRLSVLLEYHKTNAVLMSAFSSILLEIKEHQHLLPGHLTQDTEQCSLTEEPQPQWVKQMFAELQELFHNVVDLMKNHLSVFSLKSEKDIERIHSHVITLRDFYSFRMFVTLLGPEQQYIGEVLEKCIQSSLPRWFLVLCAKLMPFVSNDQEQQLDAFLGLCQHCLHQCQRALKSLNPIFKEANVDYFTHFFVALDKLLYGEAISRLENYRDAMQTTTYEIYTIFQQIAKLTEHVDPVVVKGLQTTKYHLWFKGMVNGWIFMATERCKSKIKKAIAIDEVVQVTDVAKFSSSAVDTEDFLHQIGSFWKRLDWPVAVEAYGFTCTIMESICDCALYYVGAVYESLEDPDLYDETGRFRATEKLCIILNNMAHVRQALKSVPVNLDLQTFYDWVESEEKLGKKAEDLINSLLSSSDEDIANKTSHIVVQISKKLCPDILRLIQNMMQHSQGNDEKAITPLLDYLTNNLRTLGDYLLTEVLCGILINLWEVTVQALQQALSNVPKRLTSQYLYERMYNALRRLWEFFHADGNGVTQEDLDSSEIYKILLSTLQTLRLPTRSLVHKFTSEFAEQQEAAMRTDNKKLGTLLLRVGYLRVKGVVEVSVIQGQRLPGLDKSGLSDPFVELFLLPEWLFPASAREQYKTAVHKQTLDPVFNEEFRLPAKESDLNKEGAILLLAVYDHDLIGSNDFAGLCAIACKDIPQLSHHPSLTDPNAPHAKNLILPLFTPMETAVFQELEARRSMNDSDAIELWKSQRKFMDKIYCRQKHPLLHLSSVTFS